MDRETFIWLARRMAELGDPKAAWILGMILSQGRLH